MRYATLFLVILFSCIQLSAQVTEPVKKPWKERLVTGGDVIVSVGNRYTQLGLSPILGYRVSDRYTAGIGVSYIYGSDPTYTSQIYGGRIFNRFMVFDQFFVHGEAERTNYILEPKLQRDKIRSWFPAILLGGGLRSPIGQNSFVSLTILYDVLQDTRSIYQGPIIRGGVNIGF